MSLKEEDLKSSIGKLIYQLQKARELRKAELSKVEIDKVEIEPLPQSQVKSRKGSSSKEYSVLSNTSNKKPAVEKTKQAEKNLTDIVESAEEESQQAPESQDQNKENEKPACGNPEPTSPKPEAAKPADYRVPTRRETLQMYEQLGVIGEKVTLLKLLSNICIKKSTLIEGASNAGKSWVLDHVFELVPDSMKCKTNDSRNFFDLAKRYNGQFPFIVIGELQTFLRTSKNEKDALRCIGNGEVYNYPLDDGKNLPISAWGVYTCIADTNRYKKMMVDGDKELLRRFHRVYVKLTDEKMKQRLDAIAEQQMPDYNSLSEDNINLDLIKNHIERTILLDIPQKRFFNPFAKFITEFIGESCKGSGKMEEAAKIAVQHRNYVLAGTKWNEKYRKYGKGENFRYIAGLGDIYIAKMLTDSELSEEKKPFDWYACWESGIESLKVSGYPQSIIEAYKKKHVGADNKIHMHDPVTGESVLLADLDKPKPAHIVVTNEKYVRFGNDKAGNSSKAEEKQEKEEELQAEYYPITVAGHSPLDGEIIDGEFKIIEDNSNKDPEMIGASETERKAITCEKSYLPVLYGQNNPAGKDSDSGKSPSNGLPFTERKYLTCKNENDGS